MAVKMFTINLNLSAFKSVFTFMKGKDGQNKRGIFIPLEANHLKLAKDGKLYINLVGFAMKEERDWGTHIVKQSFTKKEREEMGEETLNALPLLGNATINAETSPGDNNMVTSDVVLELPNDTSELTVGNSDDMPF